MDSIFNSRKSMERFGKADRFYRKNLSGPSLNWALYLHQVAEKLRQEKQNKLSNQYYSELTKLLGNAVHKNLSGFALDHVHQGCGIWHWERDQKLIAQRLKMVSDTISYLIRQSHYEVAENLAKAEFKNIKIQKNFIIEQNAHVIIDSYEKALPQYLLGQVNWAQGNQIRARKYFKRSLKELTEASALTTESNQLKRKLEAFLKSSTK